MVAFRVGLVSVLAALTCASAETLSLQINDMSLALEPQSAGGFKIAMLKDEQEVFSAHIGRSLVSVSLKTQYISGGVSLFLDGADVNITTVVDEAANARGIKVTWITSDLTRLEDCFNFSTHHWYGGPMQLNQIYPIETATVENMPYVTKETDNGAITERYWLNSAGQYIYVYPQVPLFVDYNISSNQICLAAEIAAPYSSKRNVTEMSYDLWFLTDVKAAHKHAIANYLGKPSGVPDFRMVQYPIWSTWAQFGRNITETNLLEFAKEIKAYGFENSQLEIDDLWEICYGSLTVDENKFSNFSKLVQDINDLGYRTTIWMHPFINQNCEPWYSEALASGYLVLNESGSSDTSWWNDNGTVASYVDFTNPNATEWWYERVKKILDDYGINSAKFDAGESSWSPQIPVQTGDIYTHPHHITQQYVRTCARFGDMIEVRVGFQTQDLPVFVRMVDRDSDWGLRNGLSTIITTTFQMNLAGYTMVLPDMIGGNGYNLVHEDSAAFDAIPGSSLPTKELFIRWVQANTFLPAMQFSFVPWIFDNETVEISLKYTQLHAEYAQTIYEAMNASTVDGRPVNGPLWWIAPTDEDALAIWDQYLLGEDIIVAPVLVENATSRDIYLPEGDWLAKGNSDELYVGPVWLRNYSAPLDELPYFVRKADPDAANSPHVTGILVAVAMILVFIYGNKT